MEEIWKQIVIYIDLLPLFFGGGVVKIILGPYLPFYSLSQEFLSVEFFPLCYGNVGILTFKIGNDRGNSD